MATNNPLNQASEVFTVGPIGTTPDGSVLLTVQKNAASNTAQSIINTNTSGTVFYQLKQQMSSSGTIASGGLGIYNDTYTKANVAGFLTLQNNINGVTEPGLGLCLYGSQSTDIVKVAIGSTVVTQATWDATGGKYRGYNSNLTPTAGYIGERVVATLALGSATVLTTATAKTVVSIDLTPGIWDISFVCAYTAVGGAPLATFVQSGISTTNNSYTGSTQGDSNIVTPLGPVTGGLDQTQTIPSVRVLLSSNTTYYGIAGCGFSANGVSAYGRLSAVRVA